MIKVKRYNIWPVLPRKITRPRGVFNKFEDIRIVKSYRFVPLRPDGARQPDVEGRVAMRIAAMKDNRYCCGSVIGR